MKRRHALLAGAQVMLTPPLLRAAADSDDSALVVETLHHAGNELTLQFAGPFSPATRREARLWVKRSAGAVVGYFGRFPVATLELLLVSVQGSGVRGGATFAEPQPYVRVRVGRDTNAQAFRDDWILVHEMVHMAVPRLARAHNWLHEGLATYVEGVARTQAGITTPRQLWGELARGMPQGQPADGDQGLDHTPTWGRTYWGGAMFCLLADVAIRRNTALRFGLQHALQGVLAAGGNYAVAWPVERLLSVADAAVGRNTLLDLYRTMKDRPSPIDLPGLWQQLGVERYQTGDADLQDNADLGAVRRAITS